MDVKIGFKWAMSLRTGFIWRRVMSGGGGPVKTVMNIWVAQKQVNY
jgi:hypothetical protein